MNTCENCEHWSECAKRCRSGAETQHLTRCGLCRHRDAFALHLGDELVRTWFDFPACPMYKHKLHWSEIAAGRAFAERHNRETLAAVIREEAEKAGLKL